MVFSILNSHLKSYAIDYPIKLSKQENQISSINFNATIQHQDHYGLYLILYSVNKNRDDVISFKRTTSNEKFKSKAFISIKDTENKTVIDGIYPTHLAFRTGGYSPDIGISLNQAYFELDPGNYDITVKLYGNYDFVPENLNSSIRLTNLYDANIRR